jgi:flagellar basal-body rod modification protein FlgD
MSSVTQTNNATSATNAAAATTSSTAANTQDRFLKLLVTQMKNQDPLNPMDNAQVTSQMAQLSTVSGIDKLNVTLQALSNSMTSNQSVQAASMIGHGVLVPGDGVDLANGNAFGGFELTQSAERVSITIKDKAGALIRDIQLGAQPAGTGHWQWDGTDDNGAKVADGSYTFVVNAADQAGKKTDVSGLQFGMVNSVSQGKQGVTLSVGQLDGIEISQVKQIL